MKCDACDNEAVIHITEIRRGLAYDRHLCEKCADMFLPLEESDYADYLDVLPPRHSTHVGDEPLPTKEELEMTGLHEQVVLVNLRTGEFEHAGPQKGDAFSPVWSPDSKRLAVCHSIETLQSLVLVEPGRPWRRQFLRTTFAEPASWSSDAAMIVFSHPEETGRVVLAADVTEGGIHRLSPTPGLDEFMPVWSPRDGRIAFVSRALEGTDEEKSRCSVFTTTLDAEVRLRLTRVDSTLPGRLGWSADARFLALLGVLPDKDELTDIFAPPEGTLHLIPSDGEDASDTALPGTYGSFAWVDGAARMGKGPVLLAAGHSKDRPTSALVLIDPRARETRLTVEDVFFPAGQVRASHLSPDGKTLVALRGEYGSQVACVDIEDGSTKVIEPRGEAACIGWHPAGEEIAALIRVDAGVRLEMLSPEGPRREITTFPRDDFFDVPRMVISPDGRFAAVELHAARKD